MTYEDSLKYIKIASGRGSRLGLERISEIMMKLDNPQNKIKTIHVTGTNGKGSFSAMLSSVLKSSGYKVGSFSSPAITEVTDSFRINCKEISREDFAEIMDIVYPVCESMDDKPTEFEVLTAMAFELFFQKNCDIVIVECGMGGDLDSTNVIESPFLSVITNVRKDHCSFLGNTIEEIALHKAGIIKENCPMFFGDEKIPDIIIQTAKRKSAELFRIEPYNAEPTFALSGTEFLYKNNKINLSLLGTYQINNAFNVLNCIEILRNQGVIVPDEAIIDGFKNAKWHGRFEMLRNNPVVIFDGSHNPDGINRTAESIEKYFYSPVVMLIGVMADKEYNLYADILGKYIDCAFTVTPDNPRSLDSQVLAETFLEKDIKAKAFPVLKDGVKSAYSYAKEKKLPLIALGSLYMYKEFIYELNNIV